MFKAIILLSRRDDMSPEDFADWWLVEHAPLARGLPGLRRAVFNLVQEPAGAPDGVDGVSELWFDSQADFEAAYATELGKAVAADSMAHVRSRTRTFVTENTVFGPEADAAPAAEPHPRTEHQCPRRGHDRRHIGGEALRIFGAVADREDIGIAGLSGMIDLDAAADVEPGVGG